MTVGTGGKEHEARKTPKLSHPVPAPDLWLITILTVITSRNQHCSECEEVDDEYIGDTGLDDINDGKHYWLKCMFKNPTFCLVCGKIVSVLGDVPLDEENNVPLSVTTYKRKLLLLCLQAIKHGPLVDRTGYRCKKCMMNIHIECAKEAERLKISMTCFGTPDPRSTHKLFPEHGVSTNWYTMFDKVWIENLDSEFVFKSWKQSKTYLVW